MFYTFRLKMVHLSFLLILSLLLPVSGICADTDGSYHTYGSGKNSCGKFMQHMKIIPNESNDIYSSWISGYITAGNYYSPNTFNIAGKTDIAGLMLWIENYCNQNPLKSFSDAVKTLVIELYPKRTTTAPK